MYYLYILRNEFGRLYIGQTNNLERRINDHKTNHGAKFIKDYGCFKLVYAEEFKTRTEAMRREQQLKKWRIAKKEALIAGNLELLKRL